MKFNFATMTPRHEINGVLLNAKSITIDGHCGEAEVSVEGGHVKISTTQVLQAAYEPKKRGRKPKE